MTDPEQWLAMYRQHTPTDTHACAVCPKQVKPGYLMCFAHWRLVPLDLQREVNRTWRAFERSPRDGYRKTLLARYSTAREKAIAAARAQLSTPTGEPT